MQNFFLNQHITLQITRIACRSLKRLHSHLIIKFEGTDGLIRHVLTRLVPS